MRAVTRFGLPALLAASLAACGGQDGAATNVQGSGAAAPAPATPYKPVASVVDLMRGTITLSAEVYWGSVSVVVDAEGVHENQPETDLEWIEVWSAALTLAESGNLMMMPPRAPDQGEWIRISTDLVDVGQRAAEIAQNRDFEGMLAVGEEIYNVCVECHRLYVPTLPDL
jgi:hypothetical protein